MKGEPIGEPAKIEWKRMRFSSTRPEDRAQDHVACRRSLHSHDPCTCFLSASADMLQWARGYRSEPHARNPRVGAKLTAGGSVQLRLARKDDGRHVYLCFHNDHNTWTVLKTVHSVRTGFPQQSKHP